ncbi:MAG: DUF177 domain-containing protein [Rhodospirillales bacterium]
MPQDIVIEFSHPIPVDTLINGEKEFEIEATIDQRIALAQRFGLIALDSLKAKIRLTPEKGGEAVLLRGRLEADAVQSCVVTLERMDTHIEASFERHFTSPAAECDKDEEITINSDGTDPTDAFIDGAVDIGESVAEQLALELDPFPRARGSAFNGFSSNSVSSGVPDGGTGPFSELAKIKDKLK